MGNKRERSRRKGKGKIIKRRGEKEETIQFKGYKRKQLLSVGPTESRFPHDGWLWEDGS